MTGHPADALSALLDGELSPEEERAVLAHLTGCEPCRREIAAVASARALVRGLPGVAPLPVVAAALGRADARRSPAPDGGAGTRRRGALAAAIGAAAVAGGLLLLTSPGATAPVRPRVARLVQVHATSAVNGDPLSQLVPAAVPVAVHR